MTILEVYYYITSIGVSISPHYYDFLIHYHDSIETLSFLSVIASLGFVAYQSSLFVKDYRHKRAHSEFETAYKLAGYYSKNIIPSLNAAQYRIRKVNTKLVPDFYKKANLFKEFTAEEAQSLFGNDILTKFRHEFASPDNYDYPHYEYLLNSIPTKDTESKIPAPINHTITGKKAKEAEEKRKKYLQEKAFLSSQHVVYILNNVEYFSMYFCSGLASADTVFPSLHQTYLDFIVDTYLLICYLNANNAGEELYIHTSTLYNKWRKQSLEAHNSRKKPQAKKMPKT